MNFLFNSAVSFALPVSFVYFKESALSLFLLTDCTHFAANGLDLHHTTRRHKPV